MPGLAPFLRQVVLNRAAMGAVAPTSGPVARRMADLVPERPGVVVVELGAGTGAISAALGPKLAGRGEHIAVERHAEMLEVLRTTAPWARRVHGDARELDTLLDGAGPVDAVLSTLPWSCFDATTQRVILGRVVDVLAPDGVFATVAYRPTGLRASGRRFHRMLRYSFREVLDSATIWANLPPARLVVCRRPEPRCPIS